MAHANTTKQQWHDGQKNRQNSHGHFRNDKSLKGFGLGSSASIIGITIDTHFASVFTPHGMARIIKSTPMTKMTAEGAFGTSLVRNTRRIAIVFTFCVARTSPGTSVKTPFGMTSGILVTPMASVRVGTVLTVFYRSTRVLKRIFHNGAVVMATTTTTTKKKLWGVIVPIHYLQRDNDACDDGEQPQPQRQKWFQNHPLLKWNK